MIVVYTPADGEPEHYDASTLRVSEASIVQRTVDMKWQEILEGLERDDLDAMRGIIWVLKKRTQPSLRFGDFDPGVAEMTTRMDRREIERWVDGLFSNLDDNDDGDGIVQLALDRIPSVAAEPEHARALIEARAKDPKAGAAPTSEPLPQPAEAPSPSPTSTSSGPSTSGSSPTSSTSPQPPLTN